MEMKRTGIITTAIVLLIGIVIGLTACGGSGLEGIWEARDDNGTALSRIEFFDNTEFYLIYYRGSSWSSREWGIWNATGNRLNIFGAGMSGLYTFSISRNVLTMTEDRWPDQIGTFHRIR